jgi:hypothetical protein
LVLHTQRGFFSSKKEEPKAEAEAEAAPEVSEAEKALQDRIAELEEKHTEVFDKYRRSLADFENLRNRMNKQVADAKVFGIQGFCKVCRCTGRVARFLAAGPAGGGGRAEQGGGRGAGGGAGGEPVPQGHAHRAPAHGDAAPKALKTEYVPDFNMAF